MWNLLGDFDYHSSPAGHHPNSFPERFNYGSRTVANHAQSRKICIHIQRTISADYIDN
jgi:hypothetical protein